MKTRLAKPFCGYYYFLLNIDQQVQYREIAYAVAKFETEVHMPGMDIKKIKKILMAVAYDNPDYFFWLPNSSEFQGDKLVLKYAMSKEEASEMWDKIQKEQEQILLSCCQGKETLRDILGALYQYFKENVAYASDELQQENQPRWIYSIDGVFLQKKGVCLGIAHAWNSLCRRLRVPYILVTGEAEIAGDLENHAWNMVEIDEHYRHVDLTAEICECEAVEYKYFLLQDWELEGRKLPKNTYPTAE